MTDGIPPPQHTTSSEVCKYTMHLLRDAFLLAGLKCNNTSKAILTSEYSSWSCKWLDKSHLLETSNTQLWFHSCLLAGQDLSIGVLVLGSKVMRKFAQVPLTLYMYLAWC